MEFQPKTTDQEKTKLQELKQLEDACFSALSDANKPIKEGGATPVVIEDLQIRYLLAKQAREDFEKIK